jgi:hypothetical protein
MILTDYVLKLHTIQHKKEPHTPTVSKPPQKNHNAHHVHVVIILRKVSCDDLNKNNSQNLFLS